MAEKLLNTSLWKEKIGKCLNAKAKVTSEENVKKRIESTLAIEPLTNEEANIYDTIKGSFSSEILAPKSLYLWNYTVKNIDTNHIMDKEKLQEVFKFLKKYFWDTTKKEDKYSIIEKENGTILVKTDIWLQFTFQSKKINENIVKNNIVIKFLDEDIKWKEYYAILGFINICKERFSLPIDVIDSNFKTTTEKYKLSQEWLINSDSKVEKEIGQLPKENKKNKEPEWILKYLDENYNEWNIAERNPIKTMINRKLCYLENNYRNASKK